MAREMIELVRAAEQEADKREQHARETGEAIVRKAREQAKSIVEHEIARAKAAAPEMQKQAEYEIARLVEAYEEETNEKKRQLMEKAQNERSRTIEEMMRQIYS